MKARLIVLLLFASIITGCKKEATYSPVEIPPIEKEGDKPFAVGSILQSNMVLQRDKPIKIGGYAKANYNISITATWDNAEYNALSNKNGYWEVSLPATVANPAPQSISVSSEGEKTITLKNILIGDVWVCSGQSNMVMPVGPLAPSFAGVENFSSEIASANFPQIRVLTVKEDYQPFPLSEFTTPAEWVICSPETAGTFSAAAYFFARKLHTDLNVPIGIIVSAINGSWCETWTNKQALQADPSLKNYTNANRASTLFNGMIAPLTRLSIKGFTWYQGENNQKMTPVDDYTKLNGALIKGWRAEFNQGELPFYYVQLTPFDDETTGNPYLNYLAKFREAQMNIRTSVQGSGMVVTMDAGEINNHHPKYKKQVGERLALLALNKTYTKQVACVGPQYSSFTQNGNVVTINFMTGTSVGLNTINNAPINQLFFVAGADKVFKPGTASINGDKINVIIPTGAALPVVAIRYAFTNYPITNLQNAANLPVEPFRTDNW